MKNRLEDGEVSAPSEIIKDWRKLAPRGTSVEQKIVSFEICTQIYSARRGIGLVGGQARQLQRK